MPEFAERLRVAAAAVTCADEHDVVGLRALVDRMCECTRVGDHDGALEADLAFHRRLLAVAVEARSPDGTLDADAVHHGVVDALAAADADADAARAAMRTHFSDFSPPTAGPDPTTAATQTSTDRTEP